MYCTHLKTLGIASFSIIPVTTYISVDKITIQKMYVNYVRMLYVYNILNTVCGI